MTVCDISLVYVVTLINRWREMMAICMYFTTGSQSKAECKLCCQIIPRWETTASSYDFDEAFKQNQSTKWPTWVCAVVSASTVVKNERKVSWIVRFASMEQWGNAHRNGSMGALPFCEHWHKCTFFSSHTKLCAIHGPRFEWPCPLILLCALRSASLTPLY